MSRLRTIALIVSVALHVGTAAGLVLVSASRIEQGGGDTPMEVSLDPSAASGGNGPPIDAGPSEPPPQVGTSTPPETVPASEPPPAETKPPEEEKPREVKPQEEPPPKAETPPQTEAELPPVVKAAPDTDTPEVVASEPPPPPKAVPPTPKPPPPKPPPPKPPPPKPPPPKAVAGGSAGGAAAAGRERTKKVGAAIDPGAELSCAKAVRARLRKPLGLTPRRFMVQIFVAASGAIISVRLMSSSGSPSVDQEAIRAFRSSGPFPPCPRIGASMHLEVPVINSRR